jgi:hypothetical protein
MKKDYVNAKQRVCNNLAERVAYSCNFLYIQIIRNTIHRLGFNNLLRNHIYNYTKNKAQK